MASFVELAIILVAVYAFGGFDWLKRRLCAKAFESYAGFSPWLLRKHRQTVDVAKYQQLLRSCVAKLANECLDSTPILQVNLSSVGLPKTVEMSQAVDKYIAKDRAKQCERAKRRFRHFVWWVRLYSLDEDVLSNSYVLRHSVDPGNVLEWLKKEHSELFNFEGGEDKVISMSQQRAS